MEKEILLAELTKNCIGNNKKLLELMKAYELAKLGGEVQEQQIKDIYNKILETNEFFAKMDAKRIGISKGDRITDESRMFLLSDKDFGRLMELSSPILVSQQICDKNGYYVTNWFKIECNSRRELVDFIIAELVPAPMRAKFTEGRYSVLFENKLIDAFKPFAKNA